MLPKYVALKLFLVSCWKNRSRDDARSSVWGKLVARIPSARLLPFSLGERGQARSIRDACLSRRNAASLRVVAVTAKKHDEQLARDLGACSPPTRPSVHSRSVPPYDSLVRPSNPGDLFGRHDRVLKRHRGTRDSRVKGALSHSQSLFTESQSVDPGVIRLPLITWAPGAPSAIFSALGAVRGGGEEPQASTPGHQ